MKRRESVPIVAVLLAALAVGYGLAFDGDVGRGDVAKFQFVGPTFGTPHPTGYPLLTLASGVLLRPLPARVWPGAADLLSVLAAVACAGALYAGCRRLGSSPGAAALAAGAFALLPPFAFFAVRAEVYALHSALLATALAAGLAWQESGARSDRRVAIAALAAALGHHATSWLALPAFALLAIASPHRHQLRRASVVVEGVLAVVLFTALPYLYLVARSWSPAAPYLEARADTLRQLADTVTGGTFQGHLRVSAAAAAEGWGLLLRDAGATLLVLAPLAAIGFAASARRVRAQAAAFALPFVGFAVFYDVPDRAVYLVPAVLALVPGVAAGCDRLLAARGGARRWSRAALAAWVLVAGYQAGRGALAPDPERAAIDVKLAALDQVREPALVVAFGHDDLMTLEAYRWSRGRERDLETAGFAAEALARPELLSPLARHLSRERALRLPPHDRLAALDRRVVCLASDAQAAVLARVGFGPRPLAPLLWRLEPERPPAALLPRAWIVPGARSVGGLGELAPLLLGSGFDFDDHFLVVSRGGVTAGVAPSAESMPASIEWIADEESRLALRTDARAPGWLVLDESLSSRWRATVDGRDVQPIRANAVHLALRLPAGKRLVELTRDPRPFSWRAFLADGYPYLRLAVAPSRLEGE